MSDLLFLILVGSFVAAASAYIGSIMVLKRMSLVGDALSHVALPGMAIAISFGISPLIGAFTSLIIAVFGIWYLEEHSETYPDAIVGLFFTFSLAIGVLISKEPDLLEALFGSIENINFLEGIITIVICLVLLFTAIFISAKVTVSLISEELAKSAGINTKVLNLIYLLVVGAVVALGIRFVGTLLTGALVIVPAVSARNVALGMKSYNLISVFFGVFSAVTGIIVSNATNSMVGPVVVLVSVTVFVFTYIAKSLVSRN